MLPGWRVFAPVAAAAFLGFSVYQILGEDGYFKLRDRKHEVQRLQEEVRGLAEENQRLERQIRRLRTDPSAIERIAREEMKLVRGGEVVYTLPAPELPPAPGTAQAMPKR
jgi:cell division protein FtsB